MPTFVPRLECTFLSEFAELKSSAIGSLAFVRTFVDTVYSAEKNVLHRRCRRRGGFRPSSLSSSLLLSSS